MLKIKDNLKIGLVVAGLLTTTAVIARDDRVTEKHSTAEVQDIVNTLKMSGKYHILVEGLSGAYALDNELRNKGPYTLFAPTDRAFSHMSYDDRRSLFANKDKLRQVLTYGIVKGRLDSDALCTLKSVDSMEGHQITLSSKEENGKKDLFVDKAQIKEADIACSNGIIHEIDRPIMPPLAR